MLADDKGIIPREYLIGERWNNKLLRSENCAHQIAAEKRNLFPGDPTNHFFRKFGRRVMYAVADLDAWADQRSFEATSDPEYAEHHSADSRAR